MEVHYEDSPTSKSQLEADISNQWLFNKNAISTTEFPLHTPTYEIPTMNGCEKRLEKGKGRAYEIQQPDGSLKVDTGIIASIAPCEDGEISTLLLKFPAPRNDARRAIFRERLAVSERARNNDFGDLEESGSILIPDSFINTWVDDSPTSARSFGITDFSAGIWRDFAYQWPWPELPGTSPLLSPDGFGKFFASSSDKIQGMPEIRHAVRLILGRDPLNKLIKSGQVSGELKLGNEYFSDPRTANKVDEWLLYYCHQNKSFLVQIFGDHQRKNLLKQIFHDTEELGLLRDIFALIDYKRLLEKTGFRYQSTKSFCKFYRKNGEIVLTRFRKHVKYIVNRIPSLDHLGDMVRWKEVYAAWNTPYESSDLVYLQPLQKDANSLARSYYNIRVRDDPDLKFITIYRAFFQLELYCEMFRPTICSTPELSRENKEKMKRIFFERYQPAEAELVLKISRWLVREWYSIDRLGEGEIRDTIQESLKIDEIFDANLRHFGIRFFSELLYSDLPTQTALILRNKWQLSMIKFTWRTNCWAAQDMDENGEVLLIEGQESFVEKDVEKQRRHVRPFNILVNAKRRRYGRKSFK